MLFFGCMWSLETYSCVLESVLHSLSALQQCAETLPFVVNVSQTVFPALNQDARLKRANLTNPGPILWSWRQMFLPTFVCRVFRLQVGVLIRCLVNRIRALLNPFQTA
jgi:hypothetical protein